MFYLLFAELVPLSKTKNRNFSALNTIQYSAVHKICRLEHLICRHELLVCRCAHKICRCEHLVCRKKFLKIRRNVIQMKEYNEMTKNTCKEIYSILIK